MTLPAAAAVTVAGGSVDHPVALAAGAVAVVVTMYPVTPVLSVAVREETETVRLEEVAGTGSGNLAGWDEVAGKNLFTG